jgi:SAM-dependent methyltransferase
MAHMVCPWWIGYFLAGPLRRMVQDPRAILAPLVREAMTVLEPGPGMGFFTLELARLVGTGGRVVAVDVQPRMLERLGARARKAGLLPRIDLRLASADRLGVDDLRGKVDVALAFAMVHEVPDPEGFFGEIVDALKHGGHVLFAEPAPHVGVRSFEASLAAALKSGMKVESRPVIHHNYTAVLLKE